MAESPTTGADLYTPDAGDAPPQMGATGSRDSDLGQETGAAIVSDAEIAAQAARRDNIPGVDPQPNGTQQAAPPSSAPQSGNWDAGLQQVQQDLKFSQKQNSELSGRINELQDTMISALATIQSQQPQQQDRPNQPAPPPQADPRAIVREAFAGVDMLDNDAVQSALSTALGSVGQAPAEQQDNTEVIAALHQMNSRIEQIGGELQDNRNSAYQNSVKSQYSVNDEQVQAATQQAHQNVTSKGWYAEGTPEYNGALNAEYHHVLAGMSKTSPSPTSPPAQRTQHAQKDPGTSVVRPGATPSTGAPVPIGEIPMVQDSDIWTPDAP